MNRMRVLVDGERRIVDAGVVVLRPVEDHGLALEGIRDRPGCSDSARGIRREITLVFMIALSNRLPRRPGSRRCSFIGLSTVRITLRSRISPIWQLSPIVLPLTVGASGSSRPVLHQLGDDGRHAAGVIVVLAEIFAGRLQVHQQRHLMADRCQSSLSSSTPRWRAMALRWIGALVEPPIAELTTMAFSKASRVRMSEGFRSSRPCRRCAGR
jgi:hypothetical protein